MLEGAFAEEKTAEPVPALMVTFELVLTTGMFDWELPVHFPVAKGDLPPASRHHQIHSHQPDSETNLSDHGHRAPIRP
jgi:hypothetical protein